MDWIDIREDDDARRFLERVEGFHDWYVASYLYDVLGNTDGSDLNLSRLKEGLDALTVTCRWDCRVKGQWPEVQVKFGGVRAYGISLAWMQEGCPLWGCVLEQTAQGWLFVNEDGLPLTAEEWENPAAIESNVFVVSDDVKWRPFAVVTPNGPDWWDE